MESGKVYEETCTVMLPPKEQQSAFHQGDKFPQYVAALIGEF